MKKLPTSYKAPSGYMMEQVWRNDSVALYKEKGDRYYEVFEIKIGKAETRKIAGKIVKLKEREKLPNNEAFGDFAFAPTNKERAMELFDMLTERIKNRGK